MTGSLLLYICLCYVFGTFSLVTFHEVPRQQHSLWGEKMATVIVLCKVIVLLFVLMTLVCCKKQAQPGTVLAAHTESTMYHLPCYMASPCVWL